ncbi:MAG: acyltransferase family protein [Planctomycetota bacterium]|jgi:peptidoglycan/LPS O-acetylase OafA/YrhL|nr:acyltransferase family protein [Planctomycetota bacterium]
MAAASGASSRIHYLDNLRALAMLLGVYLHGALAYAEPSRSIWIATNPQGSVAIDASIWWIHLFRMGLFFLLSGYFAKLVIHRKGLRPFLWNRGIRIALPFLLFWPVLTVAMTMVFVFAFSYVQQPQGLLQLIVAASQNPETAKSSTTYTTMHLWFLYYLLMLSLIAAVCSPWTWLNFDWLFQRKWLLALSPLALVPGVMGGGLPVASPESFVPSWWPFAWYGLFYWFGWQLFGREDLLDHLQPWCWSLVLAGFVMFIPHYFLLPALDIALIQQATEFGSLTPSLLESVLAAYLSSILTLSALLVGRRFLGRSNAWLKFCADSSYWVYLIHLPIILFLQTLLIPVAIPAMVKLALVILVTWLFCLATYVVFVRYTPIGWMLNGKRTFP